MKPARTPQVLLICVVLLAVFYPTLHAEFCNVDDLDMIAGFQKTQHWSFRGLFIPGASGGLYYRPLIWVTFLLERALFQLDPVWMHLDNVLLHLVNALLVYLLTDALLAWKKRAAPWLPVLAALAFGLNPLTTESVNWISGRTDLLAGVFVLSSALMLVKFKTGQQKTHLFLSLVCFLLAILSKEVSLAFLPGMFFMFNARQEGGESATAPAAWQRHKRLLVLAGIAIFLLFFLLRSYAISTNAGRIGITISVMTVDPLHSMAVVLRAFGFYLKKLAFPFPLNFAIVEVDPLYELLAVPLVLFCLYLLTRRTMIAALFLAGVALITPAFLMAFNQIAWTPYAERYLYLPLAFVLVAAALFAAERSTPALAGYGKGTFVLLLLFLALASYGRNLTWQTNLSLMKDTVEKSPYFPHARLVYASYLAKSDDLDGAKAQASRAVSPNLFGYDEVPEMFIADILKDQGKPDEAVGICRNVLEKTKGKSSKALELLISLSGKDAPPGALPSRATAASAALSDYCRHYHSTQDPRVSFQLGTAYLALKDRELAQEQFEKALHSHTADSEVRKDATQALARLGEE